ncbi:MAG TPA: DUF6471 domain-containing protein [Castellaniella sp.]|uniref:DUF6471 domain-containing protein n=1 Tax=Castellaniella sp. TaxID=1955812 RepID=UPI002F136EDE
MKPDTSPIRQSETLAVLKPYVQALIRDAMRRRKVTFKELSVRLAGLGIQASENTLIQKIRRAEFPAHFLIACLRVLEVNSIDLRELDIAHTIRKKRPPILSR